MPAFAELSEAARCWVDFWVCKLHQLPSRLPKIFHCKLLSSRQHSHIYKYAKVTLGYFPLKQKEFSVAIFRQQHTMIGLLRITEGGENTSVNCHYLALKAPFWPPHPLARESCHRHSFHLCPNTSLPIAVLVLLTPKMGKSIPREIFLGKKPLLDWDFFLQTLQFISRWILALFFMVSAHTLQQQNATQVTQVLSEAPEFPLALELS